MTKYPDFDFDVSRAAELKFAFARAGWKLPEVMDLTKRPEILPDTLDVMRGDAKVVRTGHVIDGDAPPPCPEDSIVVRHVPCGIIKCYRILPMEPPENSGPPERPQDDGPADPEMRRWYSSCGIDRTHFVPRWLIGKPILNANVHAYVLKYPHLLRHMFLLSFRPTIFWGTVYRSKDCADKPLESGGFWVRGLSGPEMYGHEMRVDMDEGWTYGGSQYAALLQPRTQWLLA